MRPTYFLLTAALLSAPLAAQTTKTPPPGAHPGDKQMSCEAVAAERAQIAAAAGKRADGQVVAAKRKHAAFGFLKGIAAGVVPGAALGLGGIGGQAAYLASGQAINAVSSSGTPTKAGATQSKEETERLTRLDEIAAYRSCGA